MTNTKNGSNQGMVPEARAAMDRFKMEAAAEVGVNLKQGYNGDLTSRQAGSVGGQMVKKIAGVRVPLLENVDFEIRPYSLFNAPKWYADGIHLLKVLAQTAIEREFIVAKLGLLEHARKKTTQKVNLFEKVQIPGYQDALRKIKRFMEDEENLSKSSQKIMKSHQESRKEAEA